MNNLIEFLQNNKPDDIDVGNAWEYLIMLIKDENLTFTDLVEGYHDLLKDEHFGSQGISFESNTAGTLKYGVGFRKSECNEALFLMHWKRTMEAYIEQFGLQHISMADLPKSKTISMTQLVQMIENINFGKGIITDKQIDYLNEEMLKVEYLEGKYSIEVGWHVNWDFEGFIVYLLGNGTRDLFLFEENCDTTEQLKNALEKAVNLAHTLMDTPDDEIPYQLSFPTPSSVTNPIDHLLGKVEVEWESKKSNVTEEMIREVENKWGFVLPEKLKQIILACNGGGPIPCTVNYKDSNFYFERLYSFHPQDSLNIYEKIERLSGRLPKGVLPFGYGLHFGDLTICLDYRSNTDQPKIKVLRIRGDEELIIEEEHHIADSLEDFLAQFYYNMQWSENSEKGSPERLIKKLEQLEECWQITLPHHYKKLILQHHGEIPKLKLFYHEKGKGELECFLTINPTDEENSVLHVYQQYFEGTLYYPFAKCKNDQYLCHDYTKENPGVVLWDAKKDQFYKVKNSFAQFLEYLDEEWS